VGRYGRQPAYFALKDHGVRHQDLANIVGRSTGFVSAVLNGFSIPNGMFVDAVSETLGSMSKGELFTPELLEAMGKVTQERLVAGQLVFDPWQ
jgi:hypothetical protein